jgi:hypothetical protein
MTLVERCNSFFCAARPRPAKHLANAIKPASLALRNFVFDEARRDQARDDKTAGLA